MKIAEFAEKHGIQAEFRLVHGKEGTDQTYQATLTVQGRTFVTSFMCGSKASPNVDGLLYCLGRDWMFGREGKRPLIELSEDDRSPHGHRKIGDDFVVEAKPRPFTLAGPRQLQPQGDRSRQIEEAIGLELLEELQQCDDF